MVWADGTYNYKKTITVDYTKVSTATETNFPLLISVTDVDLKSVGNGGHVETGYDFKFYAADETTVLYHEIEWWEDSTGEFTAWVKIPSLSHTANTVINIYYGNSTVTVDQSSPSTWNANYKNVYHMKDGVDTSHSNDSTISGINLDKKGANEPLGILSIGKIGVYQNFDGTGDFAGTNKTMAQLGITKDFTISCWLKTDTPTTYQNLLGSNTVDIILDNSPNDFKFIVNATGTAEPHASTPTTNWTLITGTYDGTTTKLYANGSIVSSSILASGNLTSGGMGDGALYIGRTDIHDSDWFNGFIDDVTLSDIARSATWIATEYANQNSPSTFMSWSAESTILITKSLSDTTTVSESLKKGFGSGLSNSITVSEALSLMQSGHSFPVDSVSISDALTFYLYEPEAIHIYTGTPGSSLGASLHKPYFFGINGDLNFNMMNFSFRSGNRASYVEDINDEKIGIAGYENKMAMQKFIILSAIADAGTEVIVTNLNSEWTGYYIIESFSYSPIGLDVFDYKIILKFKRRL